MYFNDVKSLRSEEWADLKAEMLGVCPKEIKNDEDVRVSTAHTLFDNFRDHNNVKVNQKLFLEITGKVVRNLLAPELVALQPSTGIVSQIKVLRVMYATPPESTLSFPQTFTVPVPTTAILEGSPGRKLKIEIRRETIELTKKVIEISHGEHTVSQCVADIVNSVDHRILTKLRSLMPEPLMTYDQSRISGTATFVGDECAALAIMINRGCNNIAQRTRRGAGNFIVVSPTALTILQAASTSAFARTTSHTNTGESGTHPDYVGTLNSSINVYIDRYASTSEPVLIGYKGSIYDSGIFYSPYLLDIENNEMVITDSVFAVQNGKDYLGNANDYYSSIGINSGSIRFV